MEKIVLLPKAVKEAVTAWGDKSDFDYLVSTAINVASPDTSVEIKDLTPVKIEISKDDEDTLRFRAVLAGESMSDYLAQLLNKYTRQ